MVAVSLAILPMVSSVTTLPGLGSPPADINRRPSVFFADVPGEQGDVEVARACGLPALSAFCQLALCGKTVSPVLICAAVALIAGLLIGIISANPRRCWSRQMSKSR